MHPCLACHRAADRQAARHTQHFRALVRARQPRHGHAERPPTIHDFGRSLPAPLFDLQYPAPGDPQLAGRVRELVGTAEVSLDQDWGLDHGTWSVLLKAYPDADVPVVQLSIDASRPGAWHHELGRTLRPLRDEGVLIMGTGNVVHNLGVMQWSDTAEPYDWATRFNDYVIGAIRDDEPDKLFEPQSLGRDATLSVPSMDHYLPLLYVLGARHRGRCVAHRCRRTSCTSRSAC
ncbi:MAG: class III extradiol ring-cleavage dioxygenase [Woeseiaceae bacterium]|nr:class III extradiol ring-cleavage dioxygenase [Woeseiaceae bacterium]